jgi:CRP/FNR family cyclic AMP-dependent transcriptional regulator
VSEPSAERIRLLSMVDIFEPLSEQEVEQLNGQLPDVHLEPGNMFYGPDDQTEKLFILQKGKIRIFRMSPDGREFTLAVVEAGTVFGEMALTAQQLEGAYAQAMESSQISTMAREDLERLVLEKPEVGLRIMEVLSERLRRQENRLEDATMKDVHSPPSGHHRAPGRERGRKERHGLQDTCPLHPRAPRYHDRGQQGGRHACLRVTAGRGGRGAEKAPDLR